jgi:hypothetical protein
MSPREISPTALPRQFANCRPSLELLKSWTPNLISGLIIIAMLERKYSGAEQLIVKFQKEYQTLKRETDGKPSMIKRFSLKTIVLGLSLKLSPTRSHQR